MQFQIICHYKAEEKGLLVLPAIACGDGGLRFPKIGTGCDPWGDESKLLRGLPSMIPGGVPCKPSNQPFRLFLFEVVPL